MRPVWWPDFVEYMHTLLIIISILFQITGDFGFVIVYHIFLSSKFWVMLRNPEGSWCKLFSVKSYFFPYLYFSSCSANLKMFTSFLSLSVVSYLHNFCAFDFCCLACFSKILSHLDDGMFQISSSDGKTFISADDLRINLWNLEISNQSFNIVDVKPANMEDLTGKLSLLYFYALLKLYSVGNVV